MTIREALATTIPEPSDPPSCPREHGSDGNPAPSPAASARWR